MTRTILVVVIGAVVLAIAFLATRPRSSDPARTAPMRVGVAEVDPSPVEPVFHPHARRAEEVGGSASASDRSDDPAPSKESSLMVRIVSCGVAVQGGTIDLRLAPDAAGTKREVDPREGTCSFENLEPGIYWVAVSDLPSGFLPPRAQTRRVSSEPRRFEVASGQNTVEIEVERGAGVFGYLTDPDGTPLSWGRVRFTADGADGWAHYVFPSEFTAEGGFYEGTLYPGTWLVTVTGWPKGYSGACRPRPQIVSLPEGSATQVDLRFCRGEAQLRVEIQDQDGAPFEGLQVIVSRADRIVALAARTEQVIRTSVAGGRSDAAGGFEVSGLIGGEYTLMIEPEGYHPLAGPPLAVFGAVVPPVEMTVEPNGLAIARITARRASPVRARGWIAVRPPWIAERGLQGTAPIAHVILQADSTARVPQPEFRTGIDFTPDASGRWMFDFHAEASRHPLLEVTFGDHTETYSVTDTSAPIENEVTLQYHFPN